MASSCWLSVIMPTYNGAKYLPAALASVANQAGEDVELIAVDDGSTDGTVGILRSCAPQLRMKIIERLHGGNWVASTNEGLRSAAGTYACLLHQDDLWAPNRLEVLRTWTARFPDAIAVLHPAFFVDSSGRRLGRWLCPLPVARLLPGDLLLERLLVQNFLAIPSPLFCREVVSKVGGLDEDLWYTADWDLWLKLAGVGPIAVCPDLLASFRVHRGSITSSRTADSVEMRRQLEVVLLRHLPRWQARHAQRRNVEQAARFSIEVNLALAAWTRGRPAGAGRLALRFARLGPLGWHRYFRDSRIIERASARLRLVGAR
jgi:glycosyltransferase involved in cell wall biosynthesis